MNLELNIIFNSRERSQVFLRRTAFSLAGFDFASTCPASYDGDRRPVSERIPVIRMLVIIPRPSERPDISYLYERLPDSPSVRSDIPDRDPNESTDIDAEDPYQPADNSSFDRGPNESTDIDAEDPPEPLTTLHLVLGTSHSTGRQM